MNQSESGLENGGSRRNYSKMDSESSNEKANSLQGTLFNKKNATAGVGMTILEDLDPVTKVPKQLTGDAVTS